MNRFSTAMFVGAMALWIACGSAQKGASPMSTGGAQPPHGANAQHDEIEQLAESISTEMKQMGLEPALATNPDPAAPMTNAVDPPSADPTCKPAPSDTCKQSCKLGDSICGNAKKICDLAGQMNDPWATGKRNDGQESCKKAKDSCCGCLL